MEQVHRESPETSQPDKPHSPGVVGPSKPRLLDVLGPGLITGASDDDPSGIATYSQVGAQFGYALGWTMLFSYPLMCAIQIVSARLGRTTGRGIAGNLRRHQSPRLAVCILTAMVAANLVNLGADIGAMADAFALIVPGPTGIYVAAIGGMCVVLQLTLKYTRYVKVLKWLTLALFAYVGTLFMVEVNWSQFLLELLKPQVNLRADYLTAIVAVLGTTISPYLFFWQASQEVEDIEVHPRRQPLIKAPGQAPSALHRIELDTIVGMAFSNLVALAIIVTAAATLHANGIEDITSSAQAAEALRPIAGDAAFLLFATGIIGTGLLAVPVLAGSAAYAMGETLRWPVGLARRPKEAAAFYATLVAATMIGVALNYLPIDPIQALYWAAVLNGIIAVPVMFLLMILATQTKVMGKFVIGPALRLFGWASTGVMAVAVSLMLVLNVR